MKLAIYVRVSTEEQKRKGLSLRDQTERGIECAAMHSFDEYVVFNDAGFSGELSWKNRPAFKNMLERIGSGEFRGLFVVDLNRLTRTDSAFEREHIKQVLKQKKIRLFDATHEINLNNCNEEAVADIQFIIASLFNKQTSQSISQKLERRVKDGKACGGVLQPYGYTKDKDKNLIIDSNEVAIVRQIYGLCLEGYGTMRIAEILHLQNIPTKRSIAEKGYLKVRGVLKKTFIWRDTTVYRILTNTLYKGQRSYKDNYYPCPAIIDEGTWNAVQMALKERHKFVSTTDRYFYLLKGMIKCEKCGSRFCGKKRPDNRDNQYACSSKRNKGEYCSTRGIDIDFLNDLVWKALMNLDIAIEEFYTWFEKQDLIRKYLKEVEFFQNEHETVKNRISKLITFFIDGSIEKKYYDVEMDKWRAEDERITKIIETKRLQLRTMDEKAQTISLIKPLIKKFKKSQITEKEKQEYLRIYVDAVTVNWDQQKIQHHIKVGFKIAKLSQFKIGYYYKINYKSYGWRLKRDEIAEPQILISKVFIDSDIGTEMKVAVTNVA